MGMIYSMKLNRRKGPRYLLLFWGLLVIWRRKRRFRRYLRCLEKVWVLLFVFMVIDLLDEGIVIYGYARSEMSLDEFRYSAVSKFEGFLSGLFF